MANKHPSLQLISAAIGLLLTVTGCAWEAGLPWGAWHPSVRIRASVAKDRQLPGGRFRTASEYVWQIDSLQVELAEMQLLLADDGARLTFDPAKPPAGYSLCHGGHCHAADGRLVDYADIQAELLGGGAGPTAVLLPLQATAAVVADYGPALMAAPKDLPLGTLATLRLSWRGVRVRARVWDGGPSGNRLPAQGIVVQLALPAASVAAQLKGAVGPHQPLHVYTQADLDVSIAFLDALDVAQLTAGAPFANGEPVVYLPEESPAAVALSQAWLHHASLTVVVARSN